MLIITDPSNPFGIVDSGKGQPDKDTAIDSANKLPKTGTVPVIIICRHWLQC